MSINLPLLSLSIGSFAIGMTEFSPMGLLPAISIGMGVSIPTAGLLITSYAFGVTVAAPLVTLATGRMMRNNLLVLLAGIFALGNILSAIAPDFGTLIASRIFTALCQGTFFGVGSVVAASLVPPGRQAGAVATVFMGLTLANIVGVPAATWIGESFGWRLPFWIIAAIGFVTMASLHLSLPRIPASAGANVKAEIRALTRGPVLAALALTTLISTGQFTVFTYIAPALQQVTGASVGMTTSVLVLVGVGMLGGNLLGGRAADRSLNATLIGSLAMLVVLLSALAVLLPQILPTAILFCIWGGLCFALVPTMQSRVMSSAEGAPNLASSVNIGAFNLGNGLGAAVGGSVVALGGSYPAVVMTSAGIYGLTLALVCVSLLRTRYVAAV